MSKRHKFKNKNSAKEITDKMLSTLEGRRDQITNRSTVCLAATSGLLVLAVQFIFDICSLDNFVDYLCVTISLIACIIICACSIITSLDLIKMISRKKHMGKGQKDSDPNILYFGWIELQDENTLNNLIENLTFKQHMEFEVRQAISLSKNLDYRYKQLNKTYILFIVSLCIYVLSIISFVFIKYSNFNFWIPICPCGLPA